MKRLMISLALGISGIYAQNLIPDPGFEVFFGAQTLGSNTNFGCFYGDSEFDQDMAIWRTAFHDVEKGSGNPDLVSDEVSCPHMQYGFCTSAPYPKGNHAYIEAKVLRQNACDDMSGEDSPSPNRYHEALRTNFTSGALMNGMTYIIRFKIRPLRASIEPGESEGDAVPLYYSMSPNCYAETGFCHLRTHLTTSGSGWNEDNSYNDKLNDVANVIRTFSTTNCNWEQIERSVTIPMDGSFYNLIFYMESGAFAIDDVELFPQCVNDFYIQNKDYIGSWAIESGGVYKEKVSNHLFAGNNVSAYNVPTGDVIVKNDATVIYTAGNEISLLNGFSVNEGAEFTAIIDNCPNTRSSEFAIEPKLGTTTGNWSPDNHPGTTGYDNRIVLQPNPNNGSFNMNIREVPPGEHTLSITDMAGRVVHRQTIVTDGNSINLHLDQPALPSGVYCIKIDGLDIHEKFVINK